MCNRGGPDKMFLMSPDPLYCEWVESVDVKFALSHMCIILALGFNPVNDVDCILLAWCV